MLLAFLYYHVMNDSIIIIYLNAFCFKNPLQPEFSCQNDLDDFGWKILYCFMNYKYESLNESLRPNGGINAFVYLNVDGLWLKDEHGLCFLYLFKYFS